jgi:hypothetical protein
MPELFNQLHPNIARMMVMVMHMNRKMPMAKNPFFASIIHSFVSVHRTAVQPLSGLIPTGILSEKRRRHFW